MAASAPKQAKSIPRVCNDSVTGAAPGICFTWSTSVHGLNERRICSPGAFPIDAVNRVIATRDATNACTERAPELCTVLFMRLYVWSTEYSCNLFLYDDTE
eukprot:1394200-Amorphochlora_amoeboformis.AAC.1